MCLTVPGEVVAIDGDDAVVRIGGRLRRANLLPMPGVKVGDRVMVAAGSVVARLEPDEADEIERLLQVAYGPETGGSLP